MKFPLSWLREFVHAPGDPAAVAARLGACGFAIESSDGEVLDVEVTDNRPAGLSVFGLAREVATAYELELSPPPGSGVAMPPGHAPVKVSLGDAGCGRYALAVLDV